MSWNEKVRNLKKDGSNEELTSEIEELQKGKYPTSLTNKVCTKVADTIDEPIFQLSQAIDSYENGKQVEALGKITLAKSLLLHYGQEIEQRLSGHPEQQKILKEVRANAVKLDQQLNKIASLMQRGIPIQQLEYIIRSQSDYTLERLKAANLPIPEEPPFKMNIFAMHDSMSKLLFAKCYLTADEEQLRAAAMRKEAWEREAFKYRTEMSREEWQREIKRFKRREELERRRIGI